MGFCCALFMPANLQFMPYVKHLLSARPESTSEKHSLHAATLGKRGQKDTALPESQGHRKRGKV